MFYLYVFFSPRLRHDHELFYVLLDVVFYMLPLTVFIEITCPNIITAADYIYVIRMIQKLGYSVSWINRFPCAGTGDFCDRERFILVAYYSNHCPKIDYALQHPLTWKKVKDVLMDHSLVPEEYYLKDKYGRRLDWLYAPIPRPGGFDRSWMFRMHWIADTQPPPSRAKPIGIVPWEDCAGAFGTNVYPTTGLLPTGTSWMNTMIQDIGGIRYLTTYDVLGVMSIRDPPTRDLLLRLPPPTAFRILANCIPGNTVEYIYRLICGILRTPTERIYTSRFFIKDYGILAKPPAPLPGVDTSALPYSLRRFAIEHPDRIIEAGSYCGTTLDGSAPGLRINRMQSLLSSLHNYDEDEDPDPLVAGTIAGDTTSDDMEAMRSPHPIFGTDNEDKDESAFASFQRHIQQSSS